MSNLTYTKTKAPAFLATAYEVRDGETLLGYVVSQGKGAWGAAVTLGEKVVCGHPSRGSASDALVEAVKKAAAKKAAKKAAPKPAPVVEDDEEGEKPMTKGDAYGWFKRSREGLRDAERAIERGDGVHADIVESLNDAMGAISVLLDALDGTVGHGINGVN